MSDYEEALALDTAPVSEQETIIANDATLRHDMFDLSDYDTARVEYPKLDKEIKGASKLTTANALARDVFMSFEQRIPLSRSKANMPRAIKPNAQIVEQIMSTPEYKQIKDAGTINDPFNAAIAAQSTFHEVYTSLSAEQIERMNKIAAAEDELNSLLDSAQTAREIAEQMQEGSDAQAEMQEQAAQMSEDAMDAQAALDALDNELSEDLSDAIRRGAIKGMQSAQKDIEETEQALAMFGGGYNAGTPGQAGAGSVQNAKQKIEIMNKVRNSDKLKKLAAIAGRFTRIAADVQRTKANHSAQYVHGLARGNDLSRVAPAELIKRTNPRTRKMFNQAFVAHKLTQFDLQGKEKEGKGPIICAVDNSGSMGARFWQGYTREEWSKGVLLGLLRIAQLQKRDFAVIHFDSGAQKAIVFPKGYAEPVQLLQVLEYFSGGGTSYEPWMRNALDTLKLSDFDKADVILLSDGEVGIDSKAVAEWTKQRDLRDFRTYAVLLGDTAQKGGALYQVCGDDKNVIELSDNNAKDEMSTLQTVFSI